MLQTLTYKTCARAYIHTHTSNVPSILHTHTYTQANKKVNFVAAHTQHVDSRSREVMDTSSASSWRNA